MPHTPSLVATIVAALVFAFAFGLGANRLRLPPLVGYLLAGVAIGPFTPGFVGDVGLAMALAEIGVILLMFGVGVHFSLRDLVAVYPVALPGALAQMAVSIVAGLGLAQAWGWTATAGAIMGLALSVASTVVLLRVLEERRALDGSDGRIAIGWLIVQDLAMVLALVLLPVLAPGAAARDGVAVLVALTVGKVALFGLLVHLIGRRVVPWVLVQAARTGSRELFTLAVLAVALGTAFGSAHLFGVSLALGAFFAGVVLSETDLSHQAAADSLPLRDAFAVLFFVSVGMLFDPGVVLEQPGRLLAVLAVILVAKTVVAAAVVLVAGHAQDTALRVGAGLAQIGEFSFILAGLAVALGLLPEEGRDLLLAAALVTITVNPLAFDGAGRLARWLTDRGGFQLPQRRLPRPLAAAQAPPWREHAVIVGYGRVGRAIGRVLHDLELPFVVLERDRHLAEDLRRRGLAVIWGDAAAPGVLDAAHLEGARILIVAVPDGVRARLILQRARLLNPAVDTVVRAHSDGELAQLRRAGAGVAVMGEHELALAMIQHALRSLGMREAEVLLMVQTVRGDLDPDAVPRSAPELRPHRGPDEKPDPELAP